MLLIWEIEKAQWRVDARNRAFSDQNSIMETHGFRSLLRLGWMADGF
jgi:hypothetical protein